MALTTRTGHGAYLVTLSPTPASTDWVIAGADDFNADHRNDLLLWNATTGAAEFWLMNGTTVASGAFLTSPGSALWRVAEVAEHRGRVEHDRRPGRGVVDRRLLDPVNGAQSLLDIGGAAGAVHPADREVKALRPGPGLR